MHMRKVGDKIVPKISQLGRRTIDNTQAYLQNSQWARFFSRVITRDESWVSEYDLETTMKSEEWHTASSNRSFLITRGQSSSKNLLLTTDMKVPEKWALREIWHSRQMDAPSRHPMWHCPLRHWVMDLQRHSCGSPAPLFTCSQCQWLYNKQKIVLTGRHFGSLENT